MLYLDITRLLSRLDAPTPTGIDRVEFEYARHCLATGARFVAQTSTQFVEAPVWLVRRVVEHLAARWHEGAATDPAIAHAVARWQAQSEVSRDVSPVDRFLAELARSRGPDRRAMILKEEQTIRARARRIPWPLTAAALYRAPGLLRWLLVRRRGEDGRGPALLVNPVEARNVYLNVGHVGLHRAGLFQRLARTRGLVKAIYVHDILPVSNPELFRKGVDSGHRLRLKTIEDCADLVFANSRFTRDEMQRHVPGIAVRAVLEIGVSVPAVPAAPVPARARRGFVTIGTIEPRKNHLWLVRAWLDHCRNRPDLDPEDVLTIYGKRGWLADEDHDALMRLIEGSDRVRLVCGADDAAVADALAHARAYVTAAPVEGWGMPLAESLALATPVIAADIPAHREVTRGLARFFAPGDAAGLRAGFDAMLDPGTQASEIEAAARFVPWDWPSHFARLRSALDSAPHAPPSKAHHRPPAGRHQP
ncbi:MAG: glycosyltransferase [Pseudomonadota bacterium]